MSADDKSMKNYPACKELKDTGKATAQSKQIHHYSSIGFPWYVSLPHSVGFHVVFNCLDLSKISTVLSSCGVILFSAWRDHTEKIM